jgi:hypothetical protein
MTTDLTGAAMSAPVEPTPAPETQATPMPAEPKKDPQADKRIAHLMRQEKALRAQAAKLKAERDAFAKEQQEARQAIEWKTRLKSRDFDVLKDAGLTQEDLTSYLVNQPDPRDRTIRDLQAKLEALEGNQNNFEKKMEEQVAENYKQALRTITSEAEIAAKADPQKYELVNANLDDAIQAATMLVEETWKQTGRVIPVEDALNDVEEYYLDAFAKIAASSTKIKSKLQPPAPPAPAAKTSPTSSGKIPYSSTPRVPAAPRTLTHQQVPTTSQKPMSARERAIAAFKGELKG